MAPLTISLQSRSGKELAQLQVDSEVCGWALIQQ